MVSATRLRKWDLLSASRPEDNDVEMFGKLVPEKDGENRASITLPSDGNRIPVSSKQ